jgi:type VI secretion system protein VasJ
MEEVRNTLLSFRGVEKWQDLLRESEQRLSNALLWLDLNRFTAESLAGLGSQYQDAHDAVCHETAFLLTRLPGLEKLTFSDGTPLADAETRQWLETIMPGAEAAIQGPVSQSGTADERMDELIEQSRMLVAAKKLPDAVNLLTSEMSRSAGRREKLLWRFSLAQLLVNNRQVRLALPHLEEIVEDIDTFRVEDWDPDLAVHALKIVWIGFRSDKSTRERADMILGRISRLNPVEAMRLEK